jgi:hypothetical protein
MDPGADRPAGDDPAAGVHLKPVFVNYRQRDATGTLLPHVLLVEALADGLATRFGKKSVYLDTTLRPGEPYPDALRARVADAAVLLVVIHPGWLTDLAARADRHKDWVLEEIATAIASGIRLLPVVLDGATLPSHPELPARIRALADAQAVPLRFGSLAAGVNALIAEIELIVAPDVPDQVIPVEPLPDRSRLFAVLLLFLASGLLGSLSVLSDLLPFPGLPAALATALIAGVPLFYLIVILLVTTVVYAIRRPMAWYDDRLVRTPNRAYVVFGIGILLVSMCMVGLMAIAALGFGVNALLLTLAVAASIVIVMGLIWGHQQSPTTWPHNPVRPTPISVQRAMVDLEKHLTSWQAPISLADHRNALMAMSHIRGALKTMSDPSTRTLLAWWRTRSPWITLPHSTLVALALTLCTTALVLHWTAEGPDLLGAMLWLGSVLLTIGAYWGSVALEHRRERWRIHVLAQAVPDRLIELADRLAELSRPGLIARASLN